MRLLPLALLVLATAAFAQPPDTIRIGKQTKRTTGTLTELQNGDVACYLILRDEKGAEFIEMGAFEICSQKPSPVGKRVALKYKMANVIAESCQGNPDCKKSDRVALVVSVKVITAP